MKYYHKLKAEMKVIKKLILASKKNLIANILSDVKPFTRKFVSPLLRLKVC